MPEKTKKLGDEGGVHLIINAKKCNLRKLNDMQFIYNLLDTLPGKIGMNKLTLPYLVRGADYDPGITGFLIIETSHVSIHTFTDKNFAAMDVYSCTHFDAGKLAILLKKELESKDFRFHVVER
ncbi:MAG TPA: S-adenosylmethionine decarboxylase [Candidatus Nanoarchaeia archaeon]|nr:S-adenosylmethionine decarboxylase [Candidatus Nanoarchaeia archaeon]